MFGLPMEIVGPVIGIGGIIMIAASAVVMVRRLAPKSGGDREQLSEELEVRLGELEQVKRRLSELEERVDFAERMLAQQRERPQLGPSPD
jgi:predicted nuclease with TOPRIM domain